MPKSEGTVSTIDAHTPVVSGPSECKPSTTVSGQSESKKAISHLSEPKKAASCQSEPTKASESRVSCDAKSNSTTPEVKEEPLSTASSVDSTDGERQRLERLQKAKQKQKELSERLKRKRTETETLQVWAMTSFHAPKPYIQCIVRKGYFPANPGRIKKATNGHICAIGPPPSLSFSRKGEHSRYITALYKGRDRVPVCFLV